MTAKAGPATRLVQWDGGEMLARLDDVLRVYVAAMRYAPEIVSVRRGFVAGHTRRTAFRAVATLEEGTDRVLGFGYGYLSGPGQWWHEQVRSGLSRDEYDRWMGNSFELVELHVLPDVQGAGLGEAQLRTLLDGAPGATVILSTPEGESRAWRLYRRIGFVDVLRHHLFPGDERPFAVLGRTLPLERGR
ncbi:MAG TPA: GNAT family N-acetyltransferase [Mycobacteriales bacterium]|jgi:ribosomal protein S18 acetylase RimI-like enzyme|nr:N-acetyltransferase [Mycobacterium sp.]